MKTILYIEDDDRLSAGIIRTLLNALGADVVSLNRFSNCEDAERILAEEDCPDLIICDQSLGAGKMLGTEFLGRVRASVWGDVPFILFTSGSLSENESTILVACGGRLVEKPGLAEIVSTAASILDLTQK